MSVEPQLKKSPIKWVFDWSTKPKGASLLEEKQSSGYPQRTPAPQQSAEEELQGEWWAAPVLSDGGMMGGHIRTLRAYIPLLAPNGQGLKHERDVGQATT